LDLGFAPISNAYLKGEDLSKPEMYYPLRVKVCQKCFLVQTEDYAQATELFNSNYAYFSSTSSSWLRHAEDYVTMISRELSLNSKSFVIEIASNDGYLLKNFVKNKIPCLGIEPTESTANVAIANNIKVLKEFFSEKLGSDLKRDGMSADLIIANNVFAHVPDVNNFSKGLKLALKPRGVITLEFPHLMRLMNHNQFDTIYHEHFSYFSLSTVQKILKCAGLKIWRVDSIPTHGGSLRVYGCHDDDPRVISASVFETLDEEEKAGMGKIETYMNFQNKANDIKNTFIRFLLDQYQVGKKVCAYGAAAKGNTLINYAGIKGDLIQCVFDAAPSKQGSYLPGSHIPIKPIREIDNQHMDFLIVLPWNIADEIIIQNQKLYERGVKFVRFIPNMQIL
jgi:SAM-dependent methyltransferase